VAVVADVAGFVQVANQSPEAQLVYFVVAVAAARIVALDVLRVE